jgi:molybdopterin-synthase adenylyltransferase
MDRFDRSTRLFGKEGLARIQATKLAIVGAGGIGTHVIQQTALLGTRDYAIIDDQTLDITNLNRYVGVTPNDVGTPKVVLAERLVHSIDPLANVGKINNVLASNDPFDAIKRADIVFGCIDNEGARLVLTEVCAAYAKPLFDLASDTEATDRTRYGGRVIAAFLGNGCPVCLGELDLAEANDDLSTPEQRRQRDALYGVNRADLDDAGPAVVSINGVVASLAVTEFMVHVTGIRPPQPVLTYHGHLAKVTTRSEPPPKDCYYCSGIWNHRERADVERYFD